MSKRAQNIGLALLLTAIVFAPALVAGQARGAQPPGGFPDLVAGLKATPGCLGVETARTAGGKQVIFAWFEDKKAALNWYYSDMHQGVMKQFFPGNPGGRKPMADVPADGVPVLAIASLTLAPKAPEGVTSLPISQIAIELYTPLPGGLALGGRFAPDALKVPGMQVAPLSPPTKD